MWSVSPKKCIYTGLFIFVPIVIMLLLVERNVRMFDGFDDRSVHGTTRSDIHSEGFDDDARIGQYHTTPVNEHKLRMQARLEHVKEVCGGYSKLDNWKNMRVDGKAWEYKPKELSYCFTPKVGCTFWKSVIRFLSHDFKGNAKSPGDINRYEVHNGPLKHARVYNLRDSKTRTLLSKGKSFMFTRDPYSRLWSAYLDKFFLPDFWHSDAKLIMKAIRSNATMLQKKCANDITFEEFLTFVVKEGKTGKVMEPHYTPVYRLCNPCLMKFDYIGKQERFVDDSKYILHELDLEYIMENYTSDNRDEGELKTLINYNFDFEGKIVNGCFDLIDVAERLWKTFQMNGYLPNHAAFPRTRFQDTARNRTNTRDDFTSLVFNTYEKYKSDAAVWKKQRRAALVDNFRKVSPAIVLQLEQIFKPDFELFSYDPRPDDIFNRLKD